MEYEVEALGRNRFVVVSSFDREQVSDIFESRDEAEDWIIDQQMNSVDYSNLDDEDDFNS